ncbi:hypothetical protein PENSPDRAFT_747516 [Peniophora sp. CONT]|nr:hypothetical protein PENSPDRAFT_747516 [Peniophora sp. CONT]
MSELITFYDMPRKGSENRSESEQCWSPNNWKTRFALNIKGLRYKTEWLSFTAVEPKMKELGVGPQPGPLKYTLPTIYDPKTKKVITESFAIATYLDEAYPETPRLVAPGAAGLHQAFLEKVAGPLLSAMFPLVCMSAYEQCCMNEADEHWFRTTRESWFGGKRLEDIGPKGEALTEACKGIGGQLDGIAKLVAANGMDAVFIGGDSPSHADTAIAATLLCALRLNGKDSEVSRVILGHKWAGNFIKAMSKWE